MKTSRWNNRSFQDRLQPRRSQTHLLGVPDRPGIAYQILGPLAEANIEIDMIIQNVGHDGTTDFSFTVPRGEFAKATAILEQVRPHRCPLRSPETTRSPRYRLWRRHALPRRHRFSRCSIRWRRKASTSR
ncbi:MAG: ACT domain-containing protein [Rhodocyclaceae bacterium]|nr:ACT domain-containing protein [Rhodocyclaceae bacterium]